MIDTNALLLCDTYKVCHGRMYPKSLKVLTSYWVPRKSMFQNKENQKYNQNLHHKTHIYNKLH